MNRGNSMSQCSHCGVVDADVDPVQYTTNYPGDQYVMLCDACFNELHDT